MEKNKASQQARKTRKIIISKHQSEANTERDGDTNVSEKVN